MRIRAGFGATHMWQEQRWKKQSHPAAEKNTSAPVGSWSCCIPCIWMCSYLSVTNLPFLKKIWIPRSRGLPIRKTWTWVSRLPAWCYTENQWLKGHFTSDAPLCFFPNASSVCVPLPPAKTKVQLGDHNVEKVVCVGEEFLNPFPTTAYSDFSAITAPKLFLSLQRKGTGTWDLFAGGMSEGVRFFLVEKLPDRKDEEAASQCMGLPLLTVRKK